MHTILLFSVFGLISSVYGLQIPWQPKIRPKVMIVAMFQPEEDAWTSRIEFPHTVDVVGMAPQYPGVRCTNDYSICQFTTGEGEINAAATVAFVVSSPKFELSKTFWLLSGIAGGDPSMVTTGSVTFAQFAIQVGLQYQIDSSELQATYGDWPAGYFGYGARTPWEYPNAVYGSEIFELNGVLRDRAVQVSKKSERTLKKGNDVNKQLKALYSEPASGDPTVVACDVLTSDNYFTGKVLSHYFKDYAKLISNNTANYCSAAQEENGSLEALIRVARGGLVDFERIMVMRTISNFVYGPPTLENDGVSYFLDHPKGGFQHAVDNLYYGGWPVVKDIIENWHIYDAGKYSCTNYVGDILGTLGGKPPFGRDSYRTE